MSVIAEFSIPASQFVLGKALQEAPDLEVELEQMIPVGKKTIPYFWIVGENRDRVDAVLAEEPELTDYEVVDELDNRTLYRVEWNPEVDTFIQAIVNHDAVLQEADGDSNSWVFQLRFPGSHVLSEFHTTCQDAGIDVSIQSLYNPITPEMVNTRDMTDAQRSLIEQAYDEGYFDVPRRITLTELSEKLDVSDQAVNERLRRGLSSLITTTLKSDTSRDD